MEVIATHVPGGVIPRVAGGVVEGWTGGNTCELQYRSRGCKSPVALDWRKDELKEKIGVEGKKK